MRIGLFGYGKMGKTIEKLALANGDEIILKIDIHNRQSIEQKDLQQADAVIEFTRPESAFENIRLCLEAGVPVVSGTTGWLEKIDEIKVLCEKLEGAFLYASNFSLGVNLFFALNEWLAQTMNRFSQYQVDIEEIHHIQKLDAPSGTAITLAEGILKNYSQKRDWVNKQTEAKDLLPIVSKREKEVPGTHSIRYHSEVDVITIKHEAFSREGFASGALTAAQWLVGKKGCFGMRDVLMLP